TSLPLLAQTVAPDSRPPILRNVAIAQRLDHPLPLDLPFRDEAGRTVHLADYFGKRPVVLVLAYYNCPMLCTQVLNGLLSSLRVLPLDVGREFEVVTVSFDPRDTPAAARAKKEPYVGRYGRRGAAAGWHFLTGEPRSIAGLTDAVGFRYAWAARYGAVVMNMVRLGGVAIVSGLSVFLVLMWRRDRRRDGPAVASPSGEA